MPRTRRASPPAPTSRTCGWCPIRPFTRRATSRSTRRAACAANQPPSARWTYANIALCRAALVDGIPPGTRAALGPLLFDAAHADRLSGEALTGEWHNIGTPEQLAALA